MLCVYHMSNHALLLWSKLVFPNQFGHKRAMQSVFGSLCGNWKLLRDPYLTPIKTLKLVVCVYIFLKSNIITHFFQTAITLPDKSITNTFKPTSQKNLNPESIVSFWGA